MSLRYVVRHVTRFSYSEPVRETLMELRMQPRSEERQICLAFELAVEPQAHVHTFRDYQGNVVHHFDIPRPISELAITAISRLQVQEAEEPPGRVSPAVWDELERGRDEGEHFDFLSQTARTRASADALEPLVRELGIARRDDPLTVLRNLNSGLNERLRYATGSTSVETPLDKVLATREGVCQDFAHLFMALAREVSIPCRYVSGYLYHRDDTSVPDASHAWVEAYLPGVGWLGFDPTNNLIVGDRHIRTAIGRDYSDVPPNRGTHKGENVTSELSVAVQVRLLGQPMAQDRFTSIGEPLEIPRLPAWYAAQQQQQQ